MVTISPSCASSPYSLGSFGEWEDVYRLLCIWKENEHWVNMTLIGTWNLIRKFICDNRWKINWSWSILRSSQGISPLYSAKATICPKSSQVWKEHLSSVHFGSVQSLSRVRLFATPWIAARQASLSITSSRSLLKLMPIKSVMPSSHLILCHPLLLLPPIPPSIRVFSNESALHMRWPKCWSFSFSISPSNEHPGLISFRMDWLDLLAVQGSLKSLLQHHSSKASIFWHSAFFTVQLSHPYMATGKTIALTRRTFVGKAMSLLFNMLSRLVITFLLRSKCLLITWLQSPSAVILEPQKISLTLFPLSPHLFPMRWWDWMPWSWFSEC